MKTKVSQWLTFAGFLVVTAFAIIALFFPVLFELPFCFLSLFLVVRGDCHRERYVFS